MSALSRAAALSVILVLGPGLPGQPGEPPPDDPVKTGELLLPGRLPWGATALASGEVLAPCEDRTLSVLDSSGQVLAQWTASARFSAPVTVGPASSSPRLAAPLVSGRIEVLTWDPQTKVLASVFSVAQTSEAVATAWGPSGTLYAAWRNGRVEAWTARGTREWAADFQGEAGQILADESQGVYIFGSRRVALFNAQGRESRSWSFEGRPRGVLQTMAGDLYVWTETGLWRQVSGSSVFLKVDSSAQLLGVVADRQDRLILTEPQQIRRISTDGILLSRFSLPRTAVTASALDDRGRVLVGTNAGLESWTFDGRLLAQMSSGPVVAPPLITDKGLVVWSTLDWKVQLWEGFRWPPVGWPVEGGNAGRSFSSRRALPLNGRIEPWADDAEFGYFLQLVASGEEGKQREVLEKFEARWASGTLFRSWPFANLILVKLARSGLTDLVLDRGRVTNNWPTLRYRALVLLAETSSPEDREELLGILQREFDPVVATAAVRALMRSGWDGDGRILRLLSDAQIRMPDHPGLAEAIIDASRVLWLIHGKGADPVLIPLISRIFQGSYPRVVKLQAQKFFQELVDAL